MGTASKNSTQWRHINGDAFYYRLLRQCLLYITYIVYIYLYIFEFDNTWALQVSRGHLFYNTAAMYLNVLYCSTFGTWTRLLSLLNSRVLMVLFERIHFWITLVYTDDNGVNRKIRLFIFSNTPGPDWLISKLKKLSIIHMFNMGSKVVWHLNHWERITHMCVGNLTIIASDNGLSPDRH